MVTVGSLQQIFTARFSARDLEEVVFSDIPILGPYHLILSFDPNLREGEAPGTVNWVGEENSTRIAVRGTPKTSKLAAVRGSIGALKNQEIEKRIFFVLTHFQLGDFHHGALELYMGPAEP